MNVGGESSATSCEGLTASEGKKDLFRQIPRVKLWLVLMLTLAFTGVMLVAAHLTHSLSLRMEAYHALYNVLTLCGCLLAMKVSSGSQSLHNTFGWARLEVLSMLSTLLFLTALCFSVSIESVQTALHVGHQDAMHHPVPVLVLGAVGLGLNALVFFLIGGYTHHQGCFLEMRDSGSVWVGRQVTQEAVQAGRRTLSIDALENRNKLQRAQQMCKELARDTCGLVIMEVCAAVVHLDNEGHVALYIDPALAVITAALLVWLSHPYGKECCHILLQTIPAHIDVEDFQKRVLKEFPEIVNVHHLHIWTFTPSKVVATAHVVFVSPRVYLSTKAALRQFFLDEGITHVTIQPECLTTTSGTLSHSTCLLMCKHHQCHERECCTSCSPHSLLSSVTSLAGARHRAPRADTLDCHEYVMEGDEEGKKCAYGLLEEITSIDTGRTAPSVAYKTKDDKPLLSIETKEKEEMMLASMHVAEESMEEDFRPPENESAQLAKPCEENGGGGDVRIITAPVLPKEPTEKTSLLRHQK